MFGSTVLEVAVGLTFCYASVALIVSTLQEALAAALRMRPRCLLDGIKSMLNDPNLNALAGAVYQHALVNPHAIPGRLDPESAKSKPAYINPAHFAVALVDAIQSVPGDYAQLGRDIDALPDPQIKRALQSIYQRAGGDMQAFELAVGAWFETAMERVSASYKRHAMMISLLLSLLLAVLFNIDSIHLFRALWQQPALAAHISSEPALQSMDALWRLPIGWQSFPPRFNDAFALNVAGWLLTASTAMFGAPFWFNLMKKTVAVRALGKE